MTTAACPHGNAAEPGAPSRAVEERPEGAPKVEARLDV